jgi:tRNA threonylcarbamoyladenosine biosynthesis protein TsaE
MVQLRSTSLSATHDIAATLAQHVRAGDTVVLAGEMGAGKTAFAQGFGAALGVVEPMTSPTFTLVHSHPLSRDSGAHESSRITLHHADLYRLTTQHEVADLALAELAEAEGIILVEWGDVVSSMLGDHLLVRLDLVDGDDDARDVSISPAGRAWSARWPRIESALTSWAEAEGTR